jgi:hypothetical protein
MKATIEIVKTEKSGTATKRSTNNGTIDLRLTDRGSSLENGSSPKNSALPVSASTPNPPSQKREERRKQRRAGVKVLVRIRPADLKDEQFEEVLATRNATRANLYVISASRSYYKRMPLRVTFPFDAAHHNACTSEETAEVVRLDHLPDGRVGVAILLRQPNTASAKKSDSTGKHEEERRFAVRHMVSATAKVTEMQSGTRMEARCSDLSVSGCYIDTLNPLPEKSKVLLQLTNNHSTFEVSAHVVSQHIGLGMGLIFDGLSSEQRSVLVDWLSKRPAPSLVVIEQSASPGNSENLQIPATLDRALITKLLRLLESEKTHVVEVAY